MMRLKLVVIGGKKEGMEIPISMPKYIIGRGDDCHLRPQSQLVSRKHCIISADNGVACIEDCDSANGTLVNGKDIRGRHELKNSDHIKIGPLELEVRLTTNEAAIHAVRNTQPHFHTNSLHAQFPPVNIVQNRTVAVKPLPTGGDGKKPLIDNGQTTTDHKIASVDILGSEINLLGWLDDGDDGRKKIIASSTKCRAAKALSSSGPLSIKGGNGAVPLVNKAKDVGTAFAVGKDNDWSIADILAILDNLPHETLSQTGRQSHNIARLLDCPSGNMVSPVGILSQGDWNCAGQFDRQDNPSKEWDGVDLLLLVALGLLLVVVLSWLFPLSWPENGRGPSGWLRWCIQNWWHILWLRWGGVAILVAALLKLLCVRARSE